MTDAWFKNAVAPDGVEEDGCRPEEAQALKLYLRGDITVAEASQKITKPTEESREDPENDLPNLWGLLQDALIEIPDSQSKIVELLCKIRQRSDCESSKESPKNLWRDLPSFANQWYDTNWWYYQNEWRNKPELYKSPEKIAQIANLARTEALLTVADVDILGDRARFEGLARLCDTLEDSKAVIDVEIYPVREWLLNAGSLLFDMAQNPQQDSLLRSGRDFREEVENGTMHASAKDERDLWQGDGGTSVQRWEFWRKRLQTLQSDSDLHEDTREAAKVALNAMR